MALQMDWLNKLINVTSPQTTVTVQDLLDFIRTEEATPCGICRNQIATASGKEDLGGSVLVGITVKLQDDWQLLFWEGNYVATISGGNLVGGIGGDPVKYTPGVQVVLLQSAASTIVNVGSGITEQDKTDIIEGVWSLLSTEGITYAEIIEKLLQDVTYEVTSEEVSGETILTIWTDATHTTPIKTINIGTPEVPKRVVV